MVRVFCPNKSKRYDGTLTCKDSMGYQIQPSELNDTMVKCMVCGAEYRQDLHTENTEEYIRDALYRTTG
jgi:hypothetical protein